MSFSGYESGAEGRPIELYLFERKGICWPYTSGDMSHVFQGITYSPQTISRGAFERDEDTASSKLKVRLDRTLKVCAQFINGSTPSPVTLTIYRMHRNDPDFIVLFKGRVSNAELESEEITLDCQSPLGSAEKSIPRHIIMRTCPHVLYGPRCALDPANYAYTGSIYSIVNNIVTVDTIPNLGADYFNAGVLVHNGTGFKAFIQDHRNWVGGQEFTLLQTPPSYWTVSDAMTAYVGCDRKHTTCRDKFDNIPNFGGFPLHPERDPFVDLTGN